MTTEQFVYWLQGFMEIEDPDRIGPKETQIIKDHLALVFKKETPNRTDGELDHVPLPNQIINPYNEPQPLWPNPSQYYITCRSSEPNSTSTSNVIC